jgi:hypothetical protein
MTCLEYVVVKNLLVQCVRLESDVVKTTVFMSGMYRDKWIHGFG